MRQLKLSVISAMVLGVFLGLAGCGGEEPELKLSPQQEREIAERLAPVGNVVMEGDVTTAAPAVATSSEPRSGETIYSSTCTTCHSTGAAGAPKFGDAAGWADRIAKGLDELYGSALNGFKGMPPKGLCMDCSDDEIRAAVDYMASNSQ